MASATNTSWVCSECERPNYHDHVICSNCNKRRWSHLGISAEDALELVASIDVSRGEE